MDLLSWIPFWPAFRHAHRMVLHFPIAFLTLCLLYDLCGLYFWRKVRFFRLSAHLAVTLGLVSLFITVIAGHVSAKAAGLFLHDPAWVKENSELAVAISMHRMLGLVALGAFVAVSVLRPLVQRNAKLTLRQKQWVNVILTAAALAVLYVAAYRGGHLQL